MHHHIRVAPLASLAVVMVFFLLSPQAPPNDKHTSSTPDLGLIRQDSAHMNQYQVGMKPLVPSLFGGIGTDNNQKKTYRNRPSRDPVRLNIQLTNTNQPHGVLLIGQSLMQAMYPYIVYHSLKLNLPVSYSTYIGANILNKRTVDEFLQQFRQQVRSRFHSVILQIPSIYVMFAKPEKLAELSERIAIIAQEVQPEHNFYIVETWGLQGHQYDETQRTTRRVVEEIVKQIPKGKVVYAGTVWSKVLQRIEGIQLHSDDGRHGNRIGNEIGAVTIVKTLLSALPSKLETLFPTIERNGSTLQNVGRGGLTVQDENVIFEVVHQIVQREP
eukprot:PhF_6_TR27860/c0_g1_i5/m.40727